MYKRVVVALDGSRVAEGILPFIEQIAGPLDMEVLLVRVVPLGMAKELRAGEPIGSVAEAVLRGSPIPVFLMRMTEAALESAAPEKRI